MSKPTLGLVGVGKIARDQHLPSIAETDLFDLVALVSTSGAAVPGLPTFATQAEMFAAFPTLDAVALCTPPSVRHALTVEALRAGKHTLIEKPPAATVSELQDLVDEARRADRCLFATWHSQFNPAVDAARDLLAAGGVQSVAVTWREDVRRWHPGQDWIFAAGGFGVFDPGINALSILTRILPTRIFVQAADLLVPANRDTPIEARLAFRPASDAIRGPVTAHFDFLQEGEQTWSIAIEMVDGRRLDLTRGGTVLAVDGVVTVSEPDTEYRRIYRRFRDLVDRNASDVDAAPLHLIADAYSVGRRRTVAAFDW
ncbi:Gfo/Idh/MocA family protein [Azospirillum griseum]|uniref:Gfo/Idh/MocA family oxidoreductase n=1 Tax=Azospirillum griseum TaxID=2496639 RepID=A0A3S0JKX4_9PROT|nr:Gfo/Idh/MocA family oxidoreductase [Azospirillum griseum]RTR23077.1 Gfo/Idh/MocA family oxidoreductase [Azospirillum griseum]